MGAKPRSQGSHSSYSSEMAEGVKSEQEEHKKSSSYIDTFFYSGLMSASKAMTPKCWASSSSSNRDSDAFA